MTEVCARMRSRVVRRLSQIKILHKYIHVSLVGLHLPTFGGPSDHSIQYATFALDVTFIGSSCACTRYSVFRSHHLRLDFEPRF